VTKRSVTHDTFVIERTYDAPPTRVFDAWALPSAKRLWFSGSEEADDGYRLDFRVGGRELTRGGPPGGPVYTYEALYRDIVSGRRIVYTYEMHMDGTRISVSVATVELEPAGGGTRLTLTEQGVFLDGHDNSAQREHGTRELLEKLELMLTGERSER
jgi:uncharacterized protein YndB with AHSA1/START domain